MTRELHVPNYREKERLKEQMNLSDDEFNKVMDGRISIIINDVKSGEHVLFKTGSCIKPEYRTSMPEDVFDKICKTGCSGLYDAAKANGVKDIETLFITVKNPNANMDIEYQLRILNTYNDMNDKKRLRNANKMIAIKELEIANIVNGEKLCDINKALA